MRPVDLPGNGPPGRLPPTDTDMTQSNRFLQLLAERDVLLADGATGTNLFAMGLQTGDAPELWNTAHPERITAHYSSFVAAGSDIVLSNSFGGNRYRLALHGAQDRVAELNRAAASLCRAVADGASRPVAVAGSMGPTGEIFAPLGELSHADAVAAFAEQAQALAAGGADVLWIETLSSREEFAAAVEGAAQADLPIVCTMSFDTNGRTMMGVAPGELMALADGIQPQLHACGTNCGVGAAETVMAILNMVDAQTRPGEHLLVAKANCGIPEYVDGEIVYNGTPELMADYARLARDAGARIIGGCCGTTPAHVAAMRVALDTCPRAAKPDAKAVVAALGDISSGARAQARGELDVAAGSASGKSRQRGGRRGRRGDT